MTKKAKPVYCTTCLSETEKYIPLKRMMIRNKGKYVNTPYRICANCKRLTCEDDEYLIIRKIGRHIILKQSVWEEGYNNEI